VHVKKVRELTKDNPGQQENIDRIEKLADAHLKHLEKKIELRKKISRKPKLWLPPGKVSGSKMKSGK